MTGEGRDRAWIDPAGEKLGCRGCAPDGLNRQQFLDHARALGLLGDGEAGVETRYTCSGPDGERVHVFKRAPGREKDVWWERGGPRPRRLLYVAGEVSPTSSIVVVEGEPAADAAHRKLELATVATVTGASGRPDADTWRWLGVEGREVLLWPDNDPQGARHMNEIGADLVQLGATVQVVDPQALGLLCSGADAVDWSGNGGVDAVLQVARILKTQAGTVREPLGNRSGNVPGTVPGRFPDGSRKAPGARIWRSWAEVDSSDLVPPVLLPGLAWKGCLSLLTADSKAGKSTLLSQALAAAVLGREFLGDVPEIGRVGVIEEMGAAWLKAWITEYGVGDADIDFVQPATYPELESYLREREPDLFIVDTLVHLATFNAADENSATDMRRLANVLRDTGGGALVLHHENRQGAYRGSSDIKAAVDQSITMKRGDFGRRNLEYSGRWPQEAVTLEFDRAGKCYSIAGEVGSVETRVLAFIREHPGVSRHACVTGTHLRKKSVYDTVNELVASGRLTDDGGQLREAVQ